jgi:hypothetical protein
VPPKIKNKEMKDFMLVEAVIGGICTGKKTSFELWFKTIHKSLLFYIL